MESPNDELTREFSVLCRSLGWKFTASRYAVYRFMRGNCEHPGVDVVWDAVKTELPSITRESVYRILNDFVAKGVFALLERRDDAARYDSNPARHEHFCCRKCGKFYDFTADGIEKVIPEYARFIGKIEKTELRLRGVCRECLEKTSESVEQ